MADDDQERSPAQRLVDAAHQFADGKITSLDSVIHVDEVLDIVRTADGRRKMEAAFHRAGNRPDVQDAILDFWEDTLKALRVDSGDKEDQGKLILWGGGGLGAAVFGGGVSGWLGASAALAAGSLTAMGGGIVLAGTAACGWYVFRKRHRRRKADIADLDDLVKALKRT